MTRGTCMQTAAERALGAEGQRRPHTRGWGCACISVLPCQQTGVSRAGQRPCAERGGLDRHRRESLVITRAPEDTMVGALPEHRGGGEGLGSLCSLQRLEDRGRRCVAQSSSIRETMTLLDCESLGHRAVSCSLHIPALHRVSDSRTFPELPEGPCGTQIRDQSLSEVVQPAQRFHSGPWDCCTFFVFIQHWPLINKD